MKTTSFKNMLAAIVALFITTLALPFTAQAQTYYDFKIAGVQVTSANCADLTVIPGVTGKVKYNPDTQTLTLENAHITTADYEEGLRNDIKGLTIHLVGENTITSEQKNGIFNWHERSLTFTGNGKLTVKGAMSGKKMYQSGISNNGTITVKDCTIEAEAGVYGLERGQWIFDNCTVRAKGGDSSNPDAHSISTLRDKTPEFKGCGITSPAGAVWKKDELAGFTYFTLVTADGKPVTDWVEITPAIEYDLKIAGTQVNSLNCTDLSVIDGVEGKAKYDPDTKILTLEDATITNNADPDYNDSGIGLVNKIDGLTINLVGNNTITSKLSNGIWNQPHSTLTFIGKGKLTVKGATTGQKIDQKSILNNGTITVKDCTLEAEAGVAGLSSGGWIFDHCTVRAKGGGSNEDPNEGSIGWMWDKQPEFKGCSITSPEGAVWKQWEKSGNTYFTLFTKDDKPVTDWVEITPATRYGLEIAGTQVNSLNCNDLSVIDGVSGTAKYDPDTKTLTLEDATIQASINAIISYIDGLTIHLSGTNNMRINGHTVITANCPFTIKGRGTLNVESNTDCAIYAKEIHLTIENCTVHAKGVYGIAGIQGFSEQLTIRNATVTAEGTSGSIADFAQLNLEGCAITTPAGAAFDAALKGVALNGTLVKEKVVIAPVATAIDTPAADNARSGIYTLTGIRLKGDFHQLPAGVYIVNGRKVVKH